MARGSGSDSKKATNGQATNGQSSGEASAVGVGVSQASSVERLPSLILALAQTELYYTDRKIPNNTRRKQSE
jgi:hypothetical protein